MTDTSGVPTGSGAGLGIGLHQQTGTDTASGAIAGAGTNGATASAQTQLAGSLAPETNDIGLQRSARSAARTAAQARAALRRVLATPGTPVSAVLPHFIKFIPTFVWIALVASIGFGVLGAGTALGFRRRAQLQAGQFAAVVAAAATDSLTGVLNRRGFTEAVERELARASRYDRPFMLAYVDVRGLKAVNDTEGHVVGDDLLRAVGALLKDSARADDVVGRIGGDEFGLLLPEQSAEGAVAVMRRIRAQVPESRMKLGVSTPWDLTIGIAAFPEDGETFDQLLAAADRRLYEQRGIELRPAS